MEQTKQIWMEPGTFSLGVGTIIATLTLFETAKGMTMVSQWTKESLFGLGHRVLLW